MAKRFTETGKWQGWFRRLGPVNKCLWFYLLDNCDQAGVWRVDKQKAEFEIFPDYATSVRDGLLDWEETEKILGERIHIFDEGKKWYITEFVSFQYGRKLSPKSKPHIKVMDLLTGYQLINRMMEENYTVHDTLTEGYSRGYDCTLKDKAKDQVKAKDKDKDKNTPAGEVYCDPDHKKLMEECKKVMLTEGEYNNLIMDWGKRVIHDQVVNMNLHKESTGAQYQSDYYTLLKWFKRDGKRPEKLKCEMCGEMKLDVERKRFRWKGDSRIDSFCVICWKKMRSKKEVEAL
jgi:hypothetical protein